MGAFNPRIQLTILLLLPYLSIYLLTPTQLLNTKKQKFDNFSLQPLYPTKHIFPASITSLYNLSIPQRKGFYSSFLFYFLNSQLASTECQFSEKFIQKKGQVPTQAVSLS
ncbi:hypothetical protein H5410_002263 [Solanum commersonii]|uniref:Uncharacterized protein n=1 Tax=Solanum commersonii TaxID=4109 RepID=A0A9J6B1V1_SOLCO|nr:hypothetical protein H5410_002263 [Solanum commersonii]